MADACVLCEGDIKDLRPKDLTCPYLYKVRVESVQMKRVSESKHLSRVIRQRNHCIVEGSVPLTESVARRVVVVQLIRLVKRGREHVGESNTSSDPKFQSSVRFQDGRRGRVLLRAEVNNESASSDSDSSRMSSRVCLVISRVVKRDTSRSVL